MFIKTQNIKIIKKRIKNIGNFESLSNKASNGIATL